MNILGIVAEYNPFHNGHLYHLQNALAQTNADFVVVAMSGNFIQRGEPALINKFIRANVAVKNGVDLVVEIPAYYAVSTAEKFASAGVKILNECHISHLSFGCENNDITKLNNISEILFNEPPEYIVNLKSQLNLGLSYPEARANALSEILNISKSILNKPNNILAIEYLKSILKFNPLITPVPIERVDSGYYDLNSSTNILSASGIREKLQNNEDIDIFVPNSTAEAVENPVFFKDFEQLILFSLRKLSLEQIRDLPDVTEGLENRIFSAVLNSNSLDELICNIKTKRYPLTRIKRILLSALLSFSKSSLNEFDNAGGPQYIRVLAFNEKGKELLSTISKKSNLPIITSVNKFLNVSTDLQKEMLLKDILATNIYTLVSNDKTMNLDYIRRL